MLLNAKEVSDEIENYASQTYSKKTSIQEILNMSSDYNKDNLGHYLNAYNYHPTTRNKLVYTSDN